MQRESPDRYTTRHVDKQKETQGGVKGVEEEEKKKKTRKEDVQVDRQKQNEQKVSRGKRDRKRHRGEAERGSRMYTLYLSSSPFALASRWCPRDRC